MKTSVHNVVISILLIAVMLINFVACSGISSIIKPIVPSDKDDKPEVWNEEDYPNLPIASIEFYRNTPKEDLTNQSKILVSDITGYNVQFSVDKYIGLKSYSIGDIEVSFETYVDQYTIYDTISVDDEISLEKVYYQPESNESLELNEIYADYYSVEIDYTDTGKVQGLYYLSDYYLFEYETNDKLAYIYRNGEVWKHFVYDDNGKISSETISYQETDDLVKHYTYSENGSLVSVNGEKTLVPVRNENDIVVGENTFVISNDNTISGVRGRDSGTFEYNYAFNGKKYITSKVVNGVTTEYSYLGDKIVGLNANGDSVYYILDDNLNYVGLKYNGVKYYFAVDPFGNVMSLIDCDGNVVVEYVYDIWGTIINIKGALANTLGCLNEIVNLNGIYDFDLNTYFMAADLYLPFCGTVVAPESEENFTPAVSTHEWNRDAYFTRSSVSDFAKIHDKVVDVAANNLKDAGMDVTSNLYSTDKAGNLKRLVDIYTLDYSITPFSAMNLINGNQIYEVIYHSPDSMMFEALAEEKLKTIAEELSVSYFGDYDATVGTMKFNGQFVYLNYLIDYKCIGNGIVEYQVKINKKSNYDQSVNIYDYDSGTYICYVNNTFDLNFLDGVTIIPGISKETFDVIDGYLGDYLQAVSGDICDQLLIYDDPSYYDTASMNLRPDYWSQLNLNDPTTYLEIQTDGSMKVSTMPAYETDGFKTKLLIGAGVILVTAVVATIAVMIPGANCIVVSICVGAAKGAISGALSGFAFGAISGAAGEFIGQVASGQDIDWAKIGNASLNAAADGFATGAITGAIMGGISGGLNPKYCFEAGTQIATANGAVAIENIAVGDMVWSYDYLTGEKSLKPVTATSVRETDKVINIDIGGEQITTTPEHPFYVVNNDKYHGYVAAKYLSAGDCIQTSDGGYLEITSIQEQTLDESISVYNFTVDDNHSYYVGENELLVHNVSCNEVNKHYADTQNRQFDTYKAFKKQYGRAGDGYEWHHIVEQSQVRNGSVIAQDVYSVQNTIRLDYATHRKISGIYSSKNATLTGSTTMTVRQWLTGKSYAEQYEIGVMLLKSLGVVL